MTSIKVTFFGSSTAGKTAIIKRYIKHYFQENYEPTIEDSYNTQISVEGFSVHAKIVDTSGEDDFQLLREREFLDSDYVVFVFSLSDEMTFRHAQENIGNCLSSVIKSGRTKYPTVIICGNKADLIERRRVEEEDITKLYTKIGMICPCAVINVSAKENTNLDKLFDYFATGVSQPFSNETDPKTPRSGRIVKPVVSLSVQEMHELGETKRRSRFIAFFSPRKRGIKY
ncbi:hypothetical protein EIN_154540 [Entamoeba invadens IP1]|uniref:GTP-binding protein Rhes n=1 Tax=Entamoeba invadens IP1 TaxID=370355 RepID=A0A0A1U986_ENTIV|nr:hypothetical protein EIN_154540 [Entamoeba invadens IP1]ELP91387.1 hypothetical protein EIN_154540 [Entamoeba invadens IP1]|eukprot:XP_004258158.1 hypothetical protein EIN_154540 [Entamoeba invadens IP1]